MHLQRSPRETQVFRSLAESSEGEVLVGYLKRMMRELTNTRNLKGDDIPLQVAAANKASDIIEENLIGPLSRSSLEKGEHERFD